MFASFFFRHIRLFLFVLVLSSGLLWTFAQCPLAAQEGKPEWTWMSPLPQGNDLTGIWGNGPDDVFAVGLNGAILHYDGLGWTAMLSGVTYAFQDVWGSSGDDVFVVGRSYNAADEAPILHYDGAVWTQMLTGVSESFFGVWGSSGNDVFAVGDSGVILHYDGNDWTTMNSWFSGRLSDVWGSSGNDVFVVGRDGVNGFILHYDGNDWETVYSVEDVSCPLVVWGNSADDVYVGGCQRNDYVPAAPFSLHLHYDGTEWTEFNTGVAVAPRDIWGSGADDIFNVGFYTDRYESPGSIAHYDGENWAIQYLDGGFLNGVWGSSSSDVFAVGKAGRILHFDGTDWQPMSSGLTEVHFKDVMGIGSQDLIVVGERDIYWGGGSAYFYDRSNFVGGQIEGDSISGVWVYRNDDIYVVSIGGTDLHYDGVDWDTVFSPGSDPHLSFRGIWGSDNRQLFVVGERGVILHYDGDAWGEMTSGTDEGLLGVWGSGLDDVFAVGKRGTILHYDGDAWAEMASGVTTMLYDVWGSDSNDVFAVGETVLHYDGNGWTEMTSDAGLGLSGAGVWGSSGNDVFVVGARILHYDGNNWTRMSSEAGGLLQSVWGYDANDVFAVGRNGVILHYAGPDDATITSYRVSSAPNLDGDLSDWPSLREVRLTERNANTISKDRPSEYDLSAYARSVWTDSTLYFAIRTFDNRIINDSVDVWHDDEIELGIDGLHDGDPGGADDHQYTINADGRKTDRGAPTEGFQAVVRERIDGWDAEIAIPTSSLQAGDLEAGKLMGFNWGMHDDDTGGSYDTHLIWKTDSTFSVKPGWAVLELVADPAFPITPPTVAPTPSGDTVTLQHGFLAYSGAADASISQWQPDINNGDSYTLTIRGDGAIGTLLQYDLSPLPAEITIKRATLSLYPQDRSNPQTLGADIYPLLRGWSEMQSTWNQAGNGNTWQIPGADGVTDRESVAAAHKNIDWLQFWASFDLTELVQRWVNGELANNGVVVKQIGGPAVGYDFTSRDATHWQDTPYRPELIISYWNATPTVTPTSTPTPTITPTPTPTCLDAYEPDDVWQQAKLILVDGEAQQHNFHQPGDIDYVKFGVVAGAHLALTTDNLATGVDTTLTLYDTDGVTQLAYNDIDPLNPPASRIDWIAPASGTYFLKAAHFNPATGGCSQTYELAVRRVALTPMPVSLYLPLMMK